MVILASSRNDQVLQVNPRLSDQVCLLVVVENGNLQFVVIGRLVYRETQFMIPVVVGISSVQEVGDDDDQAYQRGVCPPRRSVGVFFASLPSRAAQ